MTPSKEHLCSIFEYANGELFYKKSCGAKKAGSKAGAIKPSGRVHIQIDNKMYLLHRIVFAMHNGYMPEQIDHIDGDCTNNVIENLRPATHTQNTWNAKVRNDNVCGSKNVSYYPANNSWIVRVQANKKRQYIGSYKSKEEAERIAMKYRTEAHQEFARNGNVMTQKEATAFIATLP
jgi:hypothetical protein